MRCSLFKTNLSLTLSFTSSTSGLGPRILFSSSSRASHVRRPFTPDEDRKILELRQQGLSTQKIALQLQDRLAQVVNRRLHLLRAGIKAKSTCIEFWTPQEDAILHEKRGVGLPVEQLVEYLPGRTVDAIKHRWYVVVKDSHLEKAMRKRQNKHWTSAEKQRLVEMRYKEGLSFDSIARSLGRSSMSVRSMWSEKGPTLLTRDVYDSMRPHDAWSADETSLLETLWKDGASIGDIMRRLPGRSYRGIMNRAREWRMTRPRRAKHPSKTESDAIRRALEPVLNGTITLDEVAKDTPSSSPFQFDYQLREMRRKHKTQLPPASNAPASG